MRAPNAHKWRAVSMCYSVCQQGALGRAMAHENERSSTPTAGHFTIIIALAKQAHAWRMGMFFVGSRAHIYLRRVRAMAHRLLKNTCHGVNSAGCGHTKTQVSVFEFSSL